MILPELILSGSEQRVSPSLPVGSSAETSSLSGLSARDLALWLLATLPGNELEGIKAYIDSRLSIDLLTRLPSELALLVMSHLDSSELLVVQAVSRSWRLLADDQVLWRGLCLREKLSFHESLPRDLYEARSAACLPRPGSVPWATASGPGPMDVDEGTRESPLPWVAAFAAATSPAAAAAAVTSFEGAWPPRESTTGSHFHYPGIATLRHLVQALPANASASQSDPPPSFLPSRPPPPPPTPSVASPIRSALPTGDASLASPNFKHLYLASRLLGRRLASPSHHLSCSPLSASSSLAAGGFPGHQGSVYCVALHGAWALTGGKDLTVRLWDLTEGAERVVCVLQGGHVGSVLTLCVLAAPSAAGEAGDCDDAFRLVSGGSDGRLVLWQLNRPRDQQWVAQRIASVQAHDESVFCVRADGGTVVSCSKDRLVKTFDAATLEQRLVLSGHRGAVNAVCVRDGVIVSASGDRTIRLWAAETGELLSALPQQARGISSLDFDGRFVLSGSSDSCVRHVDLLDPQHGLGRMYDQALCAGAHNGMGEGATYACGCRCGGTVEGHTDLVRAIQFRKDFVVSAGYDQTIKIWDRQSRSLVRNLRGGHTQRILGLAADEAKIVSVGQDSRLCVWRHSQGIDTAFLNV